MGKFLSQPNVSTWEEEEGKTLKQHASSVCWFWPTHPHLLCDLFIYDERKRVFFPNLARRFHQTEVFCWIFHHRLSLSVSVNPFCSISISYLKIYNVFIFFFFYGANFVHVESVSSCPWCCCANWTFSGVRENLKFKVWTWKSSDGASFDYKIDWRSFVDVCRLNSVWVFSARHETSNDDRSPTLSNYFHILRISQIIWKLPRLCRETFSFEINKRQFCPGSTEKQQQKKNLLKKSSNTLQATICRVNRRESTVRVSGGRGRKLIVNYVATKEEVERRFFSIQRCAEWS